MSLVDRWPDLDPEWAVNVYHDGQLGQIVTLRAATRGVAQQAAKARYLDGEPKYSRFGRQRYGEITTTVYRVSC